MIYGDDQFRDVIIQKASDGLLKTNADLLLPGEVQIFHPDGYQNAAAGHQGFKLFESQTTETAGIKGSDIIGLKDIIKARSIAYQAATNKVVTLTVPATVTEGTEYILRLFVYDWGAPSAWDYTSVFGNYWAKAGDTPTEVADGLAAAINASLTTFVTTVPITVTAAAGVLTITGANVPWKKFQFDGRPVDFVASLTSPLPVAETVVTERHVGVGEGYDIKNLEVFSKLVTGDYYADSEISYTTNYDADIALTYNLVEIVYYSERIKAPGDKQRKILTIASDVTLVAGLNVQVIQPLIDLGVVIDLL